MLADLHSEERLRLVRFACSFAWADLEIRDAERDFVHDLIRRLKLSDDEAEQVEEWLSLPPLPEDVDPMEIPVKHRKIFLDTLLALVAADGELADAETESFNLLSQLVR